MRSDYNHNNDDNNDNHWSTTNFVYLILNSEINNGLIFKLLIIKTMHNKNIIIIKYTKTTKTCI